MTKKEKKETGEGLAEIFCDGGSDKLIEHYNGFSDFLGDDAQEALNSNSDLGEEIEQYMNIALAKKFAKYAGGKFVMKGGK